MSLETGFGLIVKSLPERSETWLVAAVAGGDDGVVGVLFVVCDLAVVMTLDDVSCVVFATATLAVDTVTLRLLIVLLFNGT